MIGTSLGPYKIIEQLGAGGMGEVYRARDTKLERDVAIKVLPDELAANPDRLARFTREAKLLAALNHSNIGAIHGLEDTDGIHFLVLELIEGESLEQRLRKGAIPVPEALDVARQIAEALEAAHDAGIIHRDVKPANVLLTAKGGVKVLDFGIAKSTLLDHDANAALTEQATSLTVDGTLMGTPPYMAPEQIRGEEADKRADIWAFGCVLYEMLAGKAAFARETVADTLVAVLESEPDWQRIPTAAARSVKPLLLRCLRKDRNRRLREVADGRIEIEDVITGLVVPNWESPRDEPSGQATIRTRTAALVVLSLVGGTAVLTALTVGDFQPPVSSSVIRMSIADVSVGTNRSFLISPDGNHFVFDGLRYTPRTLVHRRLETESLEPIPDTEGASRPFFSSDSRWVGFSVSGNLRKASLDANVVTDLCADCADGFTGATWDSDTGTILFSRGGSLWEVSDTGGTPQMVLSPAEANVDALSAPSFLPSGDVLLVATTVGTGNAPTISRIAVLPRGSKTVKHVGLEGSHPRYASTGHLVFSKGGEVRAVAFDHASHSLLGEEVTVLRGLRPPQVAGDVAPFSISDTGTLTYAPAQLDRRFTFIWVEPAGPQTPAHTVIGDSIQAFDLAPDDRRVALALSSQGEQDIWVVDLERTTSWPVSAEGADFDPFFTPDGSNIVYSHDNGQYSQLVTVSSDGRESGIVLSPAGMDEFAYSWSMNGSSLFSYGRARGASARDLYVRTLGDEWAHRELARGPNNLMSPAISPDGQWLLYVSDEAGWDEVYLVRYPELDDRQPVSAGGGRSPHWSEDGNLIFYRRGEDVLAVPLLNSDRGDLGLPQVLLSGRYFGWTWPAVGGGGGRQYDVASDGRFLMVQTEDAHASRDVSVVFNWFEELKERVPTGR